MRASAAGRPEEVLEVDPGASPKEVQTAWRDLSLALHPDKVRGALTADEATEAMKAVNHAKDVLLGNAPRPAAARPPPPTPTKPKKRPRAAPQPTPSKKKKAPAQRLDGALVSLQRRTPFSNGEATPRVSSSRSKTRAGRASGTSCSSTGARRRRT